MCDRTCAHSVEPGNDPKRSLKGQNGGGTGAGQNRTGGTYMHSTTTWGHGTEPPHKMVVDCTSAIPIRIMHSKNNLDDERMLIPK